MPNFNTGIKKNTKKNFDCLKSSKKLDSDNMKKKLVSFIASSEKNSAPFIIASENNTSSFDKKMTIIRNYQFKSSISSNKTDIDETGLYFRPVNQSSNY